MVKMKDLKRLVRTAQGLEPAELVLKNAEVFHAFTGEFIKCDVAIVDGYIAGLGSYKGREEIDLTGHYITAGFIDGHVHIESSMMSPREFSRAVIPTGTTTVVADPHEIANVAGTDGIQYMLDATENLPLNVYMMLPSCVPATPLEDSGASLSAEDLAPFLHHPRVLGLAEMMNAPGVLNGDDTVYDKLKLAEGACVDGHAPGLTGKPLMAYAAAGIHTDHECATKEQAMERLRAGMYVLIREGTAVKNLKALLPAVNADTSSFFCFVADDKIPAELLTEGYINEMVRVAIKEGIPVATAIQMATIKLKNLRLRAIIGINDYERVNKQDIILNIKIKFDDSAACRTENIDDTINYKEIKRKKKRKKTRKKQRKKKKQLRQIKSSNLLVKLVAPNRHLSARGGGRSAMPTAKSQPVLSRCWRF